MYLNTKIFSFFLSSSFAFNVAYGQADEPAQAAVQPAETIPVEIRVYARGTGKTIKRAEVKIGTDVFYTDKDAKVSLNIPKDGDGSVLIDRFGYKKLFIDFKKLREQTNYDAYLFPATPSDNEVFIRGEKRPEVSKKNISVEETKRVAPNDDPAQVVQLMPGVQATSFGTDVAIRGSAPEDSKYFIDNFTVTNIFHAIGDLSIMPDQLLSDVEFYSGGFGSQYGDATGGVIVLRTKTEIPEDAKTEYKVNIPFYSALYHERPLSENSMVATSFRYSYLQYILPLFIPKDSGMTVVPYFGDLHTYYLVKDPDGGHTKLMALGSQDGIELMFNYSESTEEDGSGGIDYYRGFATVGLEKLSNLGSGWTSLLTPQVLYDKSDFNLFSDKINWDYYQAKVHWEVSKRISKKEAFYLGIEPTYGVFFADIKAPVPSDDPLYDYEDAERRTVKQRLSFGGVAAWVSRDFQLGSLILTPNMRSYYDSNLKKAGIDPRLSARVELDDSNAIKAAVGLYSRTPDPAQTDETFGNPDLDFERSIHYVLGWESRWADRWETDLQVYYKTLYDSVVSDNEDTYSNAGRARSRGAEFFLRRNLTDRAFGWMSYTYSRTDYRESEEEGWHPYEYDQTHVAQLVGSYKIFATWDVGTRIKYNTGDTYTPVDDAVYNASLDKYQPKSGKDNAKRLPDYHRIDLFGTNEFLFRMSKLALRYGVMYLALTKQVYGKTYNYDYSKEKDFNSLPPIPFIELKGAF